MFAFILVGRAVYVQSFTVWMALLSWSQLGSGLGPFYTPVLPILFSWPALIQSSAPTTVIRPLFILNVDYLGFLVDCLPQPLPLESILYFCFWSNFIVLSCHFWLLNYFKTWISHPAIWSPINLSLFLFIYFCVCLFIYEWVCLERPEDNLCYSSGDIIP